MQSPRKEFLGFVGVAVLGVWLHTAGNNAAADGSSAKPTANPATDPADQPKPALATLYFGTQVCKRCHAEPLDREQEPISICRCNELTVWQQQDKHKDAYQALLGPRAIRMGKLLGSKTSVWEQKDCLVCHSAYLSEQSMADDSFRLEEGVSCAICHGPHEQWVEAHAPPFARQRDAWRRLSGKEKQAQFGLTNLRDPATRAALCASCHIGNRAEGKVITHEMYAAGHPPLAGLEVAAFSDEMPRHWQYAKEKSKTVQQTFQLIPSRYEESQVVLVGGMVAFHETMQLLAEEAADEDRKWPQVAQFDCYACHHELESPGWRQHLATDGRPGLPRSPAWPTVLVRLALCHLGQSDQSFNARLKALDEAFDVRPFGNREQISIAAGQLVDWSDRPLGTLAEATIDDAAARKLLRYLVGASQASALDYDSARQIAWAFRTLAKECFGASKWQRATAEVEFLNSCLSVRAGASALDPLGEVMQRRNDFDPKRFRDDMSRLSRLLDVPLPAPDGP